MKRIYLLLALVALMAAGKTTNAQSTDLQLLHITISDTMKYGGQTAHIIRWGFKNNGPTALVQNTDTIILERAYTSNGNNRLRLSLPTNGLPVGDTVYYADTVRWTSAPGSNPYTWCDTATAYRSGSMMMDPTQSNNTVCKTIPFVQESGNVSNIVAKNSMVLFPNPATTSVTIKYNLISAVKEAKVSVRNLVGQTVLVQNISDNNQGQKQLNIDVSKLSAGIYVAELQLDGAKIINKFSVVK